MKNAKKFIALLLTLVMALALTVPAFATTLTINEPEDAGDATYAGYMILNSTNSADDTTRFAYTLNSKYTAVLLKAINGAKVEGDQGYVAADDIIAYIAALDANGMRTFANDVYAAIKAANPAIAADKTLATGDNTVDEGYWLIAQTSDAGKLETQSLVIVDTVGKDTLTIESKKNTFTVDKTVTDESQLKCNEGHEHTAACWDWTKTNESPIGATVKFQIATSVPSNMAGYKYNAYFIVGDKMAQGLTLDKDSIEVYIGGTKAAATAYTVRFADAAEGETACEEGYTFQVALVDPKANAGKNVVVYYSAMVNKDAKLKLTGNPNEADVTYNPDSNVDHGGSSDGGFPKDVTVPVSGKTPSSFTITYATGLQFQKVDGNMKALAGAEFTVIGTTETTELKWEQKYTKVTEGGEYYLLKDGSYTKQAPVTADYMKKAAEGATAGYVADNNYTENDKVVIGDKTYRPYNPTADSKVEVYVLVKANASKYAETEPNYTYSEGWVEQTATKEYNEVIKVDDNGIANLPGLAAGTYTVSETKVPAGYNKIDDFQVKITWTAPTETELAQGKEAKCTWTAQLLDKDGNAIKNDNNQDIMLNLESINELWSLFGLQVINESGTELPSTGGIGTTIFYALGGVLVAGAAILLITKKRMSNEA